MSGNGAAEDFVFDLELFFWVKSLSGGWVTVQATQMAHTAGLLQRPSPFNDRKTAIGGSTKTSAWSRR